MLKILRNRKVAKKIWIFLAIIIIPAFCFWGLGSAIRGKTERIFVGKVFGNPISRQAFIESYLALRNQYIIQFGEEQLSKIEKYLNLESQVWDRIVLLAEVKRKRIKIGNKEVIDLIKRYPFFHREGKFNPRIYKELVTHVFHTTPREFEEQTRNNLAINRLYQQLTKDITVTDAQVKEAYNRENEQITLDYIHLSAEEFLNEVSLQQQELLDYYDKNSEQFKKPLSYNVEYIKLEQDKESEAKLIPLLREGASLQDAAKDTGLEVKETGLFEIDQPIPQIGWSTDILRILSKLKPQGKAWPQPVYIGANVAYFIQLKETKQPHIPPFNEVKAEVDQEVRQHKANQIAREKLESCRDDAELSSFVYAAEKFKLKYGITESFKRQSYVEGLGDSDEFFNAVQNLSEDQISEILSIPSGFYIVRLLERVFPNEEKFGEEKQDFTNKFLETKKLEKFNQFATELKNRPNTFMFAAE